MRSVFVVLAAILFATMKPLAANDVSPTALNEARQLFFDDQIVASMKQLRREWHRPQKMPAPVMSKERSWEGRIGFKTKRGFFEWDDESMAKERARYERALRKCLEIFREEGIV